MEEQGVREQLLTERAAVAKELARREASLREIEGALEQLRVQLASLPSSSSVVGAGDALRVREAQRSLLKSKVATLEKQYGERFEEVRAAKVRLQEVDQDLVSVSSRE